MGVDYMTCSKCSENFPDCGDFQTCEEPVCHYLCWRCRVKVDTDDYGYIPKAACPVCQAQGTKDERAVDSLERIRYLMRLPEGTKPYDIAESVNELVERMRGLCK